MGRSMGFAALAMLTVFPLLVVVAAASALSRHEQPLGPRAAGQPGGGPRAAGQGGRRAGPWGPKHAVWVERIGIRS
jgi:hypothetical protein